MVEIWRKLSKMPGIDETKRVENQENKVETEEKPPSLTDHLNKRLLNSFLNRINSGENSFNNIINEAKNNEEINNRSNQDDFA